MNPLASRALVVLLMLLPFFGGARPATAAPEGTMTWGVHITLAPRWLDPAETEGIITPIQAPSPATPGPSAKHHTGACR